MSVLQPNITESALRRERERQELTLRELGHFAKCSHMTVHRLEQGTLDVAPATKARIARALRVPVAELWPLDDPNPAGQPGSGTATTTVDGRDVLVRV
jgi:transcriptional regulator with XRE-family HTH domain